MSRPTTHQPHAMGRGVRLRRPAVDPDIPGPDRALLADPGTVLYPADRARPAPRRDFLPADPGRRGRTVDGAVIGLVAAGGTAVAGAVPLAIGVLVFQGPVAWQSATSHYALLVAQLIAVVTAVVFGVRMVRFGQLNGLAPAQVAARTHHGRYLTGTDFDAPARAALRRAQDAVDAVTASAVYRDALVDQPAVRIALAEQEWDIALALREQSGLRAERAARPTGPGAGPRTAGHLADQARAARAAQDSVARRVAALEQYVAEIRDADAAYRDWRQAEALAGLTGRHLDMLARTAAEPYHLAELEALSRHARAIQLALRERRT